MLTDKESIFVLYRAKGARIEDGMEQTTLRMSLRGAGQARDWKPGKTLPGVSNYFLGNDPAQWHRDVPAFESVRASSLMPGVDLVWYGKDHKLEYDLHVAPGIDPSKIEIAWDGARSMEVDKAGNLVLDTIFGKIAQQRPHVYQNIDGRKVEVEARYTLRKGGAAFALAKYDRSRELIIDPAVVVFSTYFGSEPTTGNLVRVDQFGSVYLSGQTSSASFPLVNPYQTTVVQLTNYVSKFNSAGSALVYSTYLGGSKSSAPKGLAVDRAGAAYLIGDTTCTDFPIKNAIQPTPANPTGTAFYDSFITKLVPAGNDISFSTYFGGVDDDIAGGIAVDPTDSSVYIGGYQTVASATPSVTPTTLNASTPKGYLAKISAAGTALQWVSYLGDIVVNDIAYHSTGLFFGGRNNVAYAPVNAPGAITQSRANDGMVGRVNLSGSTMLFLSNIGGSHTADEVFAIAVDSAGALYAAGTTASTDFFLSSPYRSYQAPTSGTFQDGFLTKFNAGGATVAYSTYIGGTATDLVNDVAVDATGAASVIGTTLSSNIPMVDSIASYQGVQDAFIVKLNPAGSAAVFSTYLGGANNDFGSTIATDAAGALYASGLTQSPGFTLVNAYQSTNPSGFVAFLTKIQGFRLPVMVMRDTYGGIRAAPFLALSNVNSGGVFGSDPTAAQDEIGDTYVAARDANSGMWLNVFRASSQTWSGWVNSNSEIQGTPSIAVSRVNGVTTAYISIRDKFNAYWMIPYTSAGGFGTWVYLAGVFATDPSIAAAPDGSIYLVGRDTYNGVWTGRYVPGTGFQNWNFIGGIIKGKPAISVGSTNVAYIAARDPFDAIWMARVQGNTMLGWAGGGGISGVDPTLIYTGAEFRITIADATGNVYSRPFQEGSVNGWGDWLNTGGILNSFASSGVAGDFFVSGRNSEGRHFWYQGSRAQWTLVWQVDESQGGVAAGPR